MKQDTATPATPFAGVGETPPPHPVPSRRDDHFYEELSRINNELANLQRELARSNADLVASNKKLEASEKHYRSLGTCVPIGILEMDASGRCLYTNLHWQTISGLTAEESLVDGWQRALDQRDAPALMEAGNRAGQAGQEFNCEVRLVNTSGELRWARVRSRAMPGESGEAAGRVSTVEDITERKQAKLKLCKLSRAVEQSPASVVITDEDGLIEYVNPKFCALTGYSFEEVLGKNPRFLKAGGISTEVYRQLWTTISIGEEWHGEFHNRKKNGELYWESATISPLCDDRGKITHFIGVKEDITDRKQAEQNLRESEEKLSKIFQSSPVAISLSTVREGRLLEVNEAYLRMVERTRGEVLGRTSHELGLWLDPAQRAGVLNQLNQQSSLRNIELDLRAKSGRMHHVLWSSEILVIEGERCLLGSALDITERKQAQVERENLERQLAEHKANEEIARLALEHEQKSSQIKSRFVSMVSHEFRTPLSIVNMAAELLDGYLDKMTEEERSEQLTNIRSSVQRMTQMMNDFLVYGNCANKKPECKPAWVKVEALCRRLISEVPNYPGSPCTIECTVDPAVEGAWLDEKILRHILGNLLSNAVKYSANDQPVKLEVARIAGSPEPEGGTGVETQAYLEFKVSDSGIGIPAADLAKLYQTFHRAANVGNRPGTGMGLAIVKQFVDLHQGTIRFESQEGKGTTVWVQLPDTSPAAPAVR